MAYTLASEWAQTHRGPAAQQAHELTNLIAGALAIVPGQPQWAIETVEGSPHRLLLLDDGRLWRLSVDPDTDEGSADSGVTTEYIVLAPGACQLTIHQAWETRSDGHLQQGGWLRRYRLEVFRGRDARFEMSVSGRELLQGGWSGDTRLDREEMFGRALAADLKWNALAESR